MSRTVEQSRVTAVIGILTECPECGCRFAESDEVGHVHYDWSQVLGWVGRRIDEGATADMIVDEVRDMAEFQTKIQSRRQEAS